MNNAPDAVYQLLLSHGMPMRNAAYTGNGFAASTRDAGGPLALHISKARNAGSMANALDREAHIYHRGIPLRDRVKDDYR
jgi:hypothetical protein